MNVPGGYTARSRLHTFWFYLSTTEIIPMGPDTYTVTASSELGSAKAKQAALKKANKYAGDRGLHMIPVNVNTGRETDFMGDTIHTYELIFRLVDESDPEYQRTNLKPVADVTVETTGADQTPTAESSDLYSELQKLKSLLDEGILTQEEFDAQKAKLLNKE